MKPGTTDYDVLIVGAGPAGSTTARFAAQGGLRVLVVEKKATPGVPVQCAEHIPMPILRTVRSVQPTLAQPILYMKTHLPDGSVQCMPSMGAIVSRDRFDRDLVDQARAAGAEILTGMCAVAFEEGTVILRGADGAIHRARPLVLVGADGPKSRVGRWIGVSNEAFVHAIQVRMPLARGMDPTEVYFRRYIPGGYGWVFPKIREANVGIGVDLRFGVAPSTALRAFAEELATEGTVRPEIRGRTAGLIPVGGMLRLRCGNVLLVGDAAGQCHPITGAGISNAVLCGEIAGEALVRAVGAGDLSLLAEYEEACEDLLGPSLRHAVERRAYLDQFWNADAASLTEALRRAWVAFDAYYEAMGEERLGQPCA